MTSLWLLLLLTPCVSGMREAKLLYETLMTGYNKLIRPAKNGSHVEVALKLKLSQLLDVVCEHEKNQIMTTTVWLTQEWIDPNFRWNPKDFGGLTTMHIPSDLLWLPDIVLYNNADGKYQISIMTKATIHYTGLVIWEPPAIYRSMCPINVRWFPFDEQNCELKFGSWTYDGLEVDLIDAARMDLSDFYESVEWDIMDIPSKRNEVKFDCCLAPYIDITFALDLRRKTLFYTIHLLIPSVALSLLTVTVFYLPSDSGEKVVLCISILISLTVFFLLLVEIIPSTSLVIPLIGLYLLFTMVMVTCSIAVTVITLNVHYRGPSTHTLPNWVRTLLLLWLPRLLCMNRTRESSNQRSSYEELMEAESGLRSGLGLSGEALMGILGLGPAPPSEALTAALHGLRYIATTLKKNDAKHQVREDWRMMSAVLDRLFLWVFCLVCAVGSCAIILRAPIIYDTREPLV